MKYYGSNPTRLGSLYKGMYFVYLDNIYQADEFIYQKDNSRIVCINCETNQRKLFTLDTIVQPIITFDMRRC